MSATPPGWYHDPWAQAPMRWWDGARWTAHLADWQGIRPGAARTGVGPSVATRLDTEQRLTPWLRGLLVVWPLATTASAIFAGATFDDVVDAVRNGGDGPATSGWWYGAQLAGIVGLAVIVLRILWLHRASLTAGDLGLPTRRSPAAAAVGWLVPIINFWWPYQGVTDLFPEYRRPDRRIAWWWATSIIAAFSPAAAIAVPYVPVGVAVAIIAVAMVPVVVAAVLEIGLVSDAVAAHADMAAGR
jgi:hypothetical protein